MFAERIVVGPFAVNCYVVGEGSAVAIVDPGAESDRIAALVEARGWRPERILLTHGHVDHVGHAGPLARRFGVGVEIHQDDYALLASPRYSELGVIVDAHPCPTPSRLLLDGDRIPVGGLELEVVHSPGHSQGSICLLHRASRQLLTGDTLFHRSVGRTDLPGSDRVALERSVRRLFDWPDDHQVWPGHGAPTSLAEERRENPVYGAVGPPPFALR